MLEYIHVRPLYHRIALKHLIYLPFSQLSLSLSLSLLKKLIKRIISNLMEHYFYELHPNWDVWWVGFSIDSWYSNGYHLCAFPHKPVSLFLWASHSKIRSQNFTIHNIPDVFSLYNSKLYDYAHCIYLTEPEIKYTTYIVISTAYIDLHLDIDCKGWLRTKR